ncbi:ubiquinone anaerobic biosynthesis accessory factor UbiT [Photobacterium aquimaris]|uniref:Ubiquinone biosynthesis accessory factor UbiT n=1 Tax=Photobacterium aquimaris TaxID=512643 RepID=A0A2T3HYY6_9GAMM|nr:SCP2 domain-containing protein [Photobacterium aquimaris]MCP4955461.1 SCP2 domain-containing protein [Photobacterium aquimaris]OBU18252.1 sterol-binding protein [Photobacterium aquimaris]PQJ40294.1 SCP2 domain-containing protein [Photobacterium aquimaris]PSU05599.1 SCP2 domain-containing protein [Photobacterium aquimaris]
MIAQLRKKLVQHGPALLRVPVKLTPFAIQKKMMLDGLAMVFKEALEDGDFEFLEDRWLKVEVRDLELQWFISYQDEKLVVAEQCEHHDVSFSGECNDLVLIAARKEDPDTLFFQRRLRIEGDTELGLEVKNLMDSIDLDSLPAPVKFVLQQSADFIHQGMQANVTDNEVVHAH